MIVKMQQPVTATFTSHLLKKLTRGRSAHKDSPEAFERAEAREIEVVGLSSRAEAGRVVTQRRE